MLDRLFFDHVPFSCSSNKLLGDAVVGAGGGAVCRRLQMTISKPPVLQHIPQTKLQSFFRICSGSKILKLLAFILLFTWYPLYPLRAMHGSAVVDPDIWWHMRSGEWILNHHSLPHADPFSITGMGKPWVAYSWSFEILLYLIAKGWDLVGIATFNLLMWLIITVAIFLFLRRSLVADFWRSIGLTFLCSLTIIRIFGPRPGLITTLLFIVVLGILLSAQRHASERTLWLLPPILLVWANVHVQFVYGLFIIGVFCVEPYLNRLFQYQMPEGVHPIRGRTLWPVFAVSALATLVNPYGFGVYRVLWDFIRQPKLYSLVTETRAMAFDHPAHFLALGITIFAAIVLGRSRQIRPLWLVLLVWAAVSAFKAERDIWVLAIVGVALIASETQTAKVQTTGLSASSRLFAVTCIALAVISSLVWLTPGNKELLSNIGLVYPVGPVAYIHEHKIEGPIFNDFNWGGFLIYALPDIPVVIDGRTNIHGQDEISYSQATWELQPGWSRNPYLANANAVIANSGAALTQELYRDPRFKAVFSDPVSVLFVRVSGPQTP